MWRELNFLNPDPLLPGLVTSRPGTPAWGEGPDVNIERWPTNGTGVGTPPLEAQQTPEDTEAEGNPDIFTISHPPDVIVNDLPLPDVEEKLSPWARPVFSRVSSRGGTLPSLEVPVKKHAFLAKSRPGTRAGVMGGLDEEGMGGKTHPQPTRRSFQSSQGPRCCHTVVTQLLHCC
jgi:hypothetical protein